jgi:transcriptional regulator with XRE-family HTH domain
MNPTHKKIGAIIRAKREAKGITQLQLSQKLGYEPMQFVSLFERGLSKIPYNVIGKLCKILALSKKEQAEITKLIFKELSDLYFKEFNKGVKSVR